MAQRYTPSQLALLVDDDNTAGLYPPVAMSGAEMNTLVLAAEFSVGLASCIIQPWVNIRSKDTNGATQDNWVPLAQVTLTAVANTTNQPAPFTAARFRAPPVEVALPNCHGVKAELISVSGGNVNLWAATANRAPR
jgi:hypothetical protein